jgi:hypothetical protein
MAKLKESLWLNRYMLSLFGVKDLKALSENLKDSRLEGYNEQNRSRLHEELVAKLYASELISAEELRQYDENIYRHTQRMSKNRGEVITWYELQISEDDLALTDFRKVQDWQEIATRLLQGYCEKSYNFARQDFLKDKMETAILTPSHDNFFDEYQHFYILFWCRLRNMLR